jgi:hypothetical protein
VGTARSLLPALGFQMGIRILVACALASTLPLTASAGRASGQDHPTTSAKKAIWVQPKTPWGDPDLQGIWPTGEMTGVPLERPASFGERTTLTDEEFAERQAQIQRRFQSFVIGAWGESGKAQRQASLIVDPPNGRMPALTPEGEKRSAPMGSSWQSRPFNGPEDFDTWDRCISRGLLPSMLPAQYSNGLEIHQAPGYVVIRNEMIHEARIIPLIGRPHLSKAIQQYMGDSRGHWEGESLFVETSNFNGKTAATNPGTSGSPMQNNIPTSDALRILERFTRVNADTINYEATIEDPVVFTRPWKVAYPFRRNQDYVLYEYACHEGNYALANLLSGSRAEQRARENNQ